MNSRWSGKSKLYKSTTSKYCNISILFYCLIFECFLLFFLKWFDYLLKNPIHLSKQWFLQKKNYKNLVYWRTSIFLMKFIKFLELGNDPIKKNFNFQIQIRSFKLYLIWSENFRFVIFRFRSCKIWTDLFVWKF